MTDPRPMRLRIFLPEKVLLDRPAATVTAEGRSGSFGLLPRHVDFVEPLVPGILSFVPAADPEKEADDAGEHRRGQASPDPEPTPRADRPDAGVPADDAGPEVFVAVDEGVLVKCGFDVRVSVRNAVRGPELGELERMVRDRFQRLDERERAMRTALAKLESEVIRSFMQRA